MKIVKLESENVKRLKAVEISPDGNLVVIGGDNGNGKSSVLDSIAYALGGKGAICSEPVNRDSEKAKVICNLGDLIVTRTFTKSGGGTLKVSTKDGANYSSPQAMLDKLVGKLSFDPLEFANMRSGDQLETLKGLVGLDFSEIEEEKKRLYDERTAVNRDGKSLKARAESFVKHEDAPGEEVSVSALMDELNRAQAINRENSGKRDQLKSTENAVNSKKSDIAKIEEEIARLQSKLETEKEDLQKRQDNHAALSKEVESLTDADEETPRQRISDAEEINRKVRENAEYEKINAELEQKRAESQKITDRIKALDNQKSEQLSSAEFPVDGLSFDESGVIYQGVPFSQASDAEKLRVSVAMGLAMNPQLKVLLIRNGSLLDEKNLAMIAEMAADNDAQIWLERVSKGKECAVIIENGEVE